MPFGDAVLSTLDTCIGVEICEELWNPARLCFRVVVRWMAWLIEGSFPIVVAMLKWRSTEWKSFQTAAEVITSCARLTSELTSLRLRRWKFVDGYAIMLLYRYMEFNTNHKHHHVPLQNGGVYMFSNVHGCDGERTYYDGCSSVAVNGDFVVQGAQFTIKDVVCSA